MNTTRWQSQPLPPAQQVDGQWRCRGCTQPITAKRRRAWCSDTCLQAYLITLGPGYARRLTYQRDHGICARCGYDTDALKNMIHAWNRRYHQLPEDQCGAFLAQAHADYQGLIMKGFPITVSPRGIRVRQSLWECDHIKPVSEGGGTSQLDNLRTLCVPCHRQVTAELRQRLAQARRQAKTQQPSLEGL